MLASTTIVSETISSSTPPSWSTPVHIQPGKVHAIWKTLLSFRQAGKCEPFSAVLKPAGSAHIGFNDFEAAVRDLPSLRMLQKAGAINDKTGWTLENAELYRAIQLVSLDEFHSTLKVFFSVMKSCTQQAQAWLGAMPSQVGESEFIPYSQKLVVEPGTRCILKGDLHGDLHSLVDFLKQLQKDGYTEADDALLLKKPIHLLFLGDYVDRGAWGLEVIYLLMLLKIKNPNHVYLTAATMKIPKWRTV